MEDKKIKQIIKIFEDSNLKSMSLEIEDIKISMEKETVKKEATYVSVPVLNEEKPIVKSGTWVKAPFVSTYYSSGSPGGKPYIKLNDYVNQGDILFVLEAMKVMNEIKSPVSGYIKEIKVNDGSMVEFDQELILIGEDSD